ncbi:hypothetical protein Leryth_024731 [Lithospermum erythrorhizon]|nr:hypothetical protein Leryth_024731 [Lithospermum erythrorhizon]
MIIYCIYIDFTRGGTKSKRIEVDVFNKEGIKQIGFSVGTDEPSWTPRILGMASLLSSTVICLALIFRTPVYDPLYGRIAAAFKELCFPSNFNTNIRLVGSIVHLLKMVGNATLQMLLKSGIIIMPLIVHIIKVICPMIFELWKGLLPPFTSPKSQGNYQSSDNVKAVKPALEDSSSRITIVAAPFFSIFTQF